MTSDNGFDYEVRVAREGDEQRVRLVRPSRPGTATEVIGEFYVDDGAVYRDTKGNLRRLSSVEGLNEDEQIELMKQCASDYNSELMAALADRVENERKAREESA
jgi:hypothetical protein